MTVRRWGYSCFAAYVDEGRYGRFVGVAETREEAESLVAQAQKRTEQAYDEKRSDETLTTPAGPDRNTLM